MHVTNEQVCSKLSQLTRVIYVINAKNDEYQSIIDSLISSYEEEHAYIIKCYQQQITALKQRIMQLTTNTASVVNGKVNEIHKRSLTAFNELQAHYDVFIKDTNNKVEQLRCEYDNKVKQMQRELTLFKGEYNDHYEQALEMKQEMINQKDTTITRLMTDIDKLKLSYEKQIYDIQNDKKSNIAHIKSSSECLIKQKDMALQAKDTLIHTHKEEIKALKVTLENKDIDFKSKEQAYQHEIELLRTYENDMKQRLISNEAIIKQIQNENDNIKQKNIALTNECKRLLHDKETQYTKLIAQHNSDMNMKNSVIDRLNDEIQSLRDECVSLRNKIKSLEDTNCMLVDTIKNENEVNNNERNAFITKSQIQIDELHTQLNAVNNELKTKNEVIKELQSRIENINKQNKNEMQVINNKNAEVVNKCNKEIKELNEQKEALVSKHREEIDRITFQHTIQINEMQLKLDSQISELKLDNIHLNERIDAYDSKINSCVVMFDDVVSGINELSDSLLIKQGNNDNNNGNNGDNSDSSSNIAKIKSSILTKLIAIQSKHTSFKNELRNIITTKPNNDNSLNSTAITAVSKKLLPSTNGVSSSSNRYISTTLKRNTIKTTTTTTHSVNTSRRSPFLRKSISQKIIITANNKK